MLVFGFSGIYQNSQIQKNMSTKKVLITLDYDPSAQKVAEEGFSLAASMGAEVILLHVLSDPAYYTTMEHITIMGFAGQIETTQVEIINMEELKETAQQFLDKSKLHLGDKTIQTLVKEGDFAESILETAKTLKTDIIVMGSHSRRKFDEIIMGSVAEKVLYHTSVPLFIVPTKHKK
jgi:nucleotide-binding universal stress UspA family protein